jgi:hypothetical protein
MLLAFIIITFSIGSIAGYFAWQLSRDFLVDGGVENDGFTSSKMVLPVLLWSVSLIAFIAYIVGIAKFSGI